MAQSIYNESRKTGTRGGIGLFEWGSLDKDQFKINYLGNSVKAPSGRMTKEKDKEKTATSIGSKRRDVDKEEMDKIRQQESDALNIALGIMPIRREEGEEEEEPVKKKRVKKEKRVKTEVKIEEVERSVDEVKEERRRRRSVSNEDYRRRRRDERRDEPKEYRDSFGRDERSARDAPREERRREDRDEERPRYRSRERRL